MTMSSNLKKSIYVYRSVKHPIKTIRDLAKFRDDGFKSIDLEFRRGFKFQNVSLGTAWMLISYYYWSNRFQVFNLDDMNQLNEIGSKIYSRLMKKFKTWPNDLWGLQGTHGIVFMLIRKFKPELTIETGIAHGYSAEVILTALSLNGKGRLQSIDIDEVVHLQNADLNIGWVVTPSFFPIWDKKIGDSKIILSNSGQIPDIFIHDSLHTKEHMLSEYYWAKEHLKPNGILISDDIDRNKAWKIFHRRNKEFKQYLRSATTGVSRKIN
jgi:hypothetical protein